LHEQRDPGGRDRAGPVGLRPATRRGADLPGGPGDPPRRLPAVPDLLPDSDRRRRPAELAAREGADLPRLPGRPALPHAGLTRSLSTTTGVRSPVPFESWALGICGVCT